MDRRTSLINAVADMAASHDGQWEIRGYEVTTHLLNLVTDYRTAIINSDEPEKGQLWEDLDSIVKTVLETYHTHNDR